MVIVYLAPGGGSRISRFLETDVLGLVAHGTVGVGVLDGGVAGAGGVGGVPVLSGFSVVSRSGSPASPAPTGDGSTASATRAVAAAPRPDALPAAVPVRLSAAPVALPEADMLAAGAQLLDSAPQAERSVGNSVPPFYLALARARAIPGAADETPTATYMTGIEAQCRHWNRRSCRG
jgi:hypothetical protein